MSGSGTGPGPAPDGHGAPSGGTTGGTLGPDQPPVEGRTVAGEPCCGAGPTREGTGMALDLARWQFGVITVYHFLFVPLTIGLSLLVAMMQTAWVRTGDER